jgi:hypothetical protein
MQLQRGNTGRRIVKRFPDRIAGSFHVARAIRRRAQHGRKPDPHIRHVT